VAREPANVYIGAMVFPPFDPAPPPRRRRFKAIPVRTLLPNLITLLALCAGLKAPLAVPDVPAATGAAELTLSPTASGVEVAPWPFRTPQLSLIAEGRRLPNTFANQDELRTALATAPWTSFAVELSPAAALL